MIENGHIINKVVVNAQGIGAENVFTWRNNLSSFLNNDLSKRLQTTMDECSSNDNILTIDKVRVNIVLKSWDNLQTIEDEILYAIQKELLAFKSKKDYPEIKGELPAQEIKVGIQMIDAWVFYLEKGYYPWYWHQSISDKQFEQNASYNKEYILSKIYLVLKNQNSRKRFVFTTTNQIIRCLLRIFVNNQIYEDLARKFLEKNIESSNVDFLIKCTFVNTIAIHNMVNDVLLKEETQQLITIVSRVGFKQKNLPDVILKGDEMARQEKNTTVPQSNQIWIQNGGIVLIHPFLKPLFAKLNIIDQEGQIIDNIKALLVLHYILYDDAPYIDAPMILPKILCGLSFDEPIRIDAELDTSEKVECKEMLRSLIWHWGALKKTSVDGLRTTFLLRKAKLLTIPNGWQLIVESKTEDILLTKLTWSFGIIKNSWMKDMIQTDWG